VARPVGGELPSTFRLWGGSKVRDVLVAAGYELIPTDLPGLPHYDLEDLASVAGAELLQQWSPLMALVMDLLEEQWANYDSRVEEHSRTREEQQRLVTLIASTSQHQERQLQEEHHRRQQQVQLTQTVGNLHLCFFSDKFGRYMSAEEVPVLFIRAALV